jgi:NADPH-dependent curcumin reductase CurA
VTRTRELHLVARPTGWPTKEDFRLVEVDLPDPGQGDLLVRNTYMSVDPYMRSRMNATKSYIDPFELDSPMEGGAVGEVVESRHPEFSTGDVVLHNAGWREHAVVGANRARKLDTSRVSASAYLGVLGMPGLTAYVGLTEIAQVREGDSVFISGAAGAVGSAAGQLAKKLGAARVIGSAGSAEKVQWLKDGLGFDEAFNYRDGEVSDLLRQRSAFDVYFDNVGGDHLEAAIGCISDFGRMALCGAISGTNEPVPGPSNMALVVTKRLTLRGFIVGDHREAASEFYRRVPDWVANGDVRHRETVVDGLDRAVEAFVGLHRGENTGKMLVRL